MNIWIIQSRGVNLFYKSYMDLPVDEVLVSGLLAALNSFIFEQFAQPIESIDMAGFRWIYIHEDELQLIFVASDTKDVNAEVLRARLEVIKQKFISTYLKDNDYLVDNWDGNISQFKSFDTIVDNYYSQWTQAETITSSADFFDVLGIFQQILNLIRKVIEKHIFGLQKEHIIIHITELFESFKNKDIVKENQELEKISFSRHSGFDILSVNPLNCNISVVRKQIIYILSEILKIIKNEIGNSLSLNYFSEVKIFDYFFNNITLLKNLNLDTFLLQLFLVH